MLQLACLAVLLLVQLPQQHVALAADLPTQAAKPSIIAVGDGLTEGAFARKHDGWGVLLQERYVRKVGSRAGRGGGPTCSASQLSQALGVVRSQKQQDQHSCLHCC
jgi:lysophospholipase L1-like esterase